MDYAYCIQLVEKLKHSIEFQEKRNFFNHKEDLHIIRSREILDAFLEKYSSNQISSDDIPEILKIIVKFMSAIDAPDDSKELIKCLNNQISLLN